MGNTVTMTINQTIYNIFQIGDGNVAVPSSSQSASTTVIFFSVVGVLFFLVALIGIYCVIKKCRREREGLSPNP